MTETTTRTSTTPAHIVAISGGVSEPSTTRMLADRTAGAAVQRLREAGRDATVSSIDLAPLATDIARTLVSGIPADSVNDAIATLADADGIILSSPVYKAGVSGLVKSFLDILDNDLIVAKPVILAATAGSPRHSMVADDHLRPLFAFLRAIPVPTALFAAPEDWGDPAMTKRIDRAAIEFAQLVSAGVATRIADAAWGGYNHTFDGRAARAEHSIDDVDFDTDLMRLATGG
ncbi:CE1759 family FMN reductase [Leucobacter sp. GX24907]